MWPRKKMLFVIGPKDVQRFVLVLYIIDQKKRISFYGRVHYVWPEGRTMFIARVVYN